MATSALRWFKAAIVLQVLLLAYWLAIEVVDLSPWNDLAARPPSYDLGWSVAINALPQLAFMLLFALGIRLLAMLSVLGYVAYLAAQLWVWWKPVVMGASADWYQRYAQLYAHTVRVIPADKLSLAPDAQHLALQALTLVTLIATVMAISRMDHL